MMCIYSGGMSDVFMANEHPRDRYLKSLKYQADHYISILEEIFGPRDPGFIFDKIGMADDGPQTFFPGRFYLGGGCRVNIQISRVLWEIRPQQGIWQVAHECVHLLDPGEFGTANILEEGLATWFQDKPEFHDNCVQQFSEDIEKNGNRKQNYLDARDLVRKYCPDILTAVKTLRSRKIRIRDIRATELAPLLPHADKKELELLCTKFKN